MTTDLALVAENVADSLTQRFGAVVTARIGDTVHSIVLSLRRDEPTWDLAEARLDDVRTWIEESLRHNGYRLVHVVSAANIFNRKAFPNNGDSTTLLCFVEPLL